MKLYDVNNDFTLSESDKTERPDGYRWQSRYPVLGVQYGYDLKTNELHYVCIVTEEAYQ
ncbi:hypothetical protein [Endozoicomonas ascidiicola]|uniref:hypothetical protein n=1 Tax=Endozoicomonas ascidiicola TaxID=1698521 RepID=UPI000A97E1AB|nr:hypothetical protein [Endozoicomonas ascidiicola]